MALLISEQDLGNMGIDVMCTLGTLSLAGSIQSICFREVGSLHIVVPLLLEDQPQFKTESSQMCALVAQQSSIAPQRHGKTDWSVPSEISFNAFALLLPIIYRMTHG